MINFNPAGILSQPGSVYAGAATTALTKRDAGIFIPAGICLLNR